MGNSIKELNWVQKIKIKAIAAINSIGQSVKRFSNTVFTRMWVNPVWGDDSFESNVNRYTTNATVYSIIHRITTLAVIPEFKVYRVRKGQKSLHRKYLAWTGERATDESLKQAMKIKSLVYEEVNEHPLNELIEKPNRWQKRDEFVVSSIGFKLLTGNRVLTYELYDMGADKGKPYDLINLPPQFMRIVPDGTPYGIKEWIFTLSDREPIPHENVIHSKYFNPDFQADGSHLYGLSPLKVAHKNIVRGDAAIDRSVATLQNAGAAGVLFERNGVDETIEQAEATSRKVNSRVNGSDNSGSISYMNGDYGYINFGQSSVDMEVLGAENISDRKLYNIYSVPPEAFNPEKANYNNAKEFDKQIITNAVIPELSSLRDDWNEVAKKYSGDDIYVDYDLSAFPALAEGQDVIAARLEKIWYMKPNEKRLAMGLDEDNDNELMNSYFVPSGLTPMEQLGEPDLTTGLDEIEDDT